MSSSTQILETQLSKVITQRELGVIESNESAHREIITKYLNDAGYWEARSWQQLLWYLQFHQSCFIMIDGEPEYEMAHIISQYQSGRNFFSIVDRASGRLVTIRFDSARAHLVIVMDREPQALINSSQKCINSARLTQ